MVPILILAALLVHVIIVSKAAADISVVKKTHGGSLLNLDSDEKIDAIRAMIGAQDKTTCADLGCLLGDPVPMVRAWAVLAISELCDEAYIRKAMELRDDDSVNVRGNVMIALGELKTEEAVEFLINGTRDDEALVVRAATKSLGKIRAMRALPSLMSLLNDDRRYVADTALLAIASIEGREFAGPWNTRVALAREWWNSEGKSAVLP